MQWTTLDAPPVLTGPRLRLRPVTTDDVDPLWAVYGDPTVARYLSHPPWPDRATAEAHVGRSVRALPEGRGIVWAITVGDDVARGTILLFHLDAEHRRGEIGWGLGRSLWGQGVGYEAASLVVRYAYDVLDLHRIEADCHPDNAGSIRLAEKLGFQHEGRLREKWRVAGEVSDSVILGLLRGEERLG